jgi:hypothetical protein
MFEEAPLDTEERPLTAAIRALPDFWRRPAVAVFMDRARQEADADAFAIAAFWLALAIEVDDGSRAERETFAAMTADLDDDERGEIVGPPE